MLRMIFNLSIQQIRRLTAIVFFITQLHCIEKPADIHYSGLDQYTYVNPVRFDAMVFDSSGYLWGISESFLYLMKVGNSTTTIMDSIPVPYISTSIMSSGDGRIYVLFSTFLMLVGRESDSIKVFERTVPGHDSITIQNAVAGRIGGELLLFDIKNNAILKYVNGTFSTELILDKGYGYSTKMLLHNDLLNVISVPVIYDDSSILYTYDFKNKTFTKKTVHIPGYTIGLAPDLYHQADSLHVLIRITRPTDVKVLNENRNVTLSEGYALGCIENNQFAVEVYLKNYVYVNYLYDNKNDISWFVAENEILRAEGSAYYQLSTNQMNIGTPVCIYNGALYWYNLQTSKLIRLDKLNGFMEVIPDYNKIFYSVNGVVDF